MLLRDFVPSPHLSRYIQLYRVVHFVFEGSHATLKAYPPRPESCLLFYPIGSETVRLAKTDRIVHVPPVAVSGQQLGMNYRSIQGREFLTIQVIFQPGMLHYLSQYEGNELIDQYVAGEDLFSKDLGIVNAKLQDAIGYDEMISIVEAFLTNLLNKKKLPGHPIEKASRELLFSRGIASIEWLARESCMSLKQFERKFMKLTGVTPKHFARVARFDRSFRLKNKRPDLDWLSVAVACGYADYQHMAKDYKSFTSLTPPQMQALENNSPEKSLGLSDEFYKSCF